MSTAFERTNFASTPNGLNMCGTPAKGSSVCADLAFVTKGNPSEYPSECAAASRARFAACNFREKIIWTGVLRLFSSLLVCLSLKSCLPRPAAPPTAFKHGHCAPPCSQQGSSG